MSTITYDASEDKEVLNLHPNHFSESSPKAVKGRFRIWWDDEGEICAVTISEFTKELEDFRKNMYSIRLGGIWKGVKVTERDIMEARRSMMRKLDKKWRVVRSGSRVKASSKKGSLKRR